MLGRYKEFAVTKRVVKDSERCLVSGPRSRSKTSRGRWVQQNVDLHKGVSEIQLVAALTRSIVINGVSVGSSR